MSPPRLVRLDEYMKSYPTQAGAVSAIRARGVNLTYLAVWRWLQDGMRPSVGWVSMLAQAGIDAEYLRNRRNK